MGRLGDLLEQRLNHNIQPTEPQQSSIKPLPSIGKLGKLLEQRLNGHSLEIAKNRVGDVAEVKAVNDTVAQSISPTASPEMLKAAEQVMAGGKVGERLIPQAAKPLEGQPQNSFEYARGLVKDEMLSQFAKPAIEDVKPGILDKIESKAKSVIGSGLDDIKDIAKAIDMATDPRTPEGNKLAHENIMDRLSYYKTALIAPVVGRIMSMTGQIDYKQLQKEMAQERQKFGEFGDVQMDVADKTSKLAFEWGWLYPKLFEGAGLVGTSIQKIPQVKSAMASLESLGGVQKIAEQYPRLYDAGVKALQNFAKGELVGQTAGAMESVGEDKNFKQWLVDMNKQGLEMGAWTTAFGLAQARDVYNHVNEVRTGLNKQAAARVEPLLRQARANKIPNTAAQQMFSQELAKIDDVVSTYERELMSGKTPIYGQKLPDTQTVIKRLADKGYFFGQEGATAKELAKVKGDEALKIGQGKSQPGEELSKTGFDETKRYSGKTITVTDADGTTRKIPIPSQPDVKLIKKEGLGVKQPTAEVRTAQTTPDALEAMGKTGGNATDGKLPVIERQASTMPQVEKTPINVPTGAGSTQDEAAGKENKGLNEEAEALVVKTEQVIPVKKMSLNELQTESEYFDKKIQAERDRLDKIAPNRQTFNEAGIEHLSPEDFTRYTSVNDEINRRTYVTPAEAKKRVMAKREQRQLAESTASDIKETPVIIEQRIRQAKQDISSIDERISLTASGQGLKDLSSTKAKKEAELAKLETQYEDMQNQTLDVQGVSVKANSPAFGIEVEYEGQRYTPIKDEGNSYIAFNQQGKLLAIPKPDRNVPPQNDKVKIWRDGSQDNKTIADIVQAKTVNKNTTPKEAGKNQPDFVVEPYAERDKPFGVFIKHKDGTSTLWSAHSNKSEAEYEAKRQIDKLNGIESLPYHREFTGTKYDGLSEHSAVIEAKKRNTSETDYDWIVEKYRTTTTNSGQAIDRWKVVGTLKQVAKSSISPNPESGTQPELNNAGETQTEPIKENINEEAIIEPAASVEVDAGKTTGTVSEAKSTGELDPTKPEDAIQIIEKHNDWLAGYDNKNWSVFSGVPLETEWSAEKRERIVKTYEYTAKQVEEAYRTVQKEIDSPMPDTKLYAMPGKEKQLQAIAEKMARVKGTVPQKSGKPKTFNAPKVLPRVSVKKEDYVKGVYKAANKDATRYALNGVYVEGENLVATNGRRMFIAKGKWGKDGIYLDSKSLKDGVLGKSSTKDAEGEELRFPNWKDIIPTDYDATDLIVIDDLETTARRMKQAALIVTTDSPGIMVIKNKNGSLGFACASPEVGHSEINVNLGGQILGAVNPNYFIEALQFHALRGDTRVEFYFPHPDRPVLIKGQQGKTITLTMPVKAGEVSEELQRAIEGISEQSTAPAYGTKEHEQYINTAVKKYDKTYSASHIVNTDMARKVLPGYESSDIANEEKYFGDAAEVTDKVYDKWLTDRKGKGNNKVVFLAGGTGSGKSTAAASPPLNTSENHAIQLNSTFTSKDYSFSLIDKAIEAGYTPEILYIYRDPVDAWENGVWTRWGQDTGHFVKPQIHLDTHISARDNVLAAAEKYGDKVQIKIIENRTDEEQKEISLDELKTKSYDIEKIKEEIDVITTKQLESHPALKGQDGLFFADSSTSSKGTEQGGGEVSQSQTGEGKQELKTQSKGSQFQPDPTIDTGAEGEAGFIGIAGRPGGKVQKPWLDTEKTASPDEDIEDFFGRTNKMPSRFKASKLLDKIKAGLRERFITVPHIPRTPDTAIARDMIRTMPEERRAAMEKAVLDIIKVLDNDGTVQALDYAGLDLLRRKVFIADLMHEAEIDRSVSGDLSLEQLQAENERLESLLDKVPSVKKAYQARQSLWEKVSNDLVDRGVMDEETAKNKSYVRHFVLSYIENNKQPVSGKRKKLSEPYRAYSKKRTGSRKDISTDYLSVEVQALSEIYADNAVEDMANAISDKYDKRKQYTRQANDANFVALVGGPENAARIRELRSLIKESPAGSKERADWIEELTELDPTYPYRKKIAMNMARLNLGDDVDNEDSLFKKLADIIKKEPDSPNGLAARGIFKAISERKKLIQDALKDEYLTPEKIAANDGYVEWHYKRPNLFYMAHTLNEAKIAAMIENIAEDAGGMIQINKNEIRQAMAVGRRKGMLIPEWLAKQLERSASK